jgi:hypothetical protein
MSPTGSPIASPGGQCQTPPPDVLPAAAAEPVRHAIGWAENGRWPRIMPGHRGGRDRRRSGDLPVFKAPGRPGRAGGCCAVRRNRCSGAPSGTLQQKAADTVRGMLAGSSRDRGKTPAPACGHAAWWDQGPPFAVSLLAGASLTARSAASSRLSWPVGSCRSFPRGQGGPRRPVVVGQRCCCRVSRVGD